MKTHLKRVLTWIFLSISMLIFWIVGLLISGAIFNENLNEAAAESGNSELILFIICLLNTAVLLYFIFNSHIKGWKLAATIFFVSFGLQYFLSQIETFWFNDALKMSPKLIWTVIVGGAISNLLFAVLATWITRGFSEKQVIQLHLKSDGISFVKMVAALSIIVWPVIYFLAGYFIAWQFSEVRQYYTGTQEMESFYNIMKGNVTSGLYFFQMVRGLIWIGIGYLVLLSVQESTFHKAIVLGLLFSVISSSQLLLPNPIMPDMVRIPHLIETGTSNFLWGIIVTWSINKFLEDNIYQTQIV